MTWPAKLMVCLTGLLVTSCASIGAGDSFCLIAKPIYVSPRDTLTDDTARAILTHDETGARICGW